jgi:hypothetical protein
VAETNEFGLLLILKGTTMLAEIFLLQIENKIRIAAPARDARFVPIALAAPVVTPRVEARR